MKQLISFFLLFSIVFSMFGCTGAGNLESSGATETTEPTEPGEVIVMDAGTPVPTQTNNRAYYHIFVGSFSDSNGDGIGDLRGIIERFDYLNDGDDTSGKSLGVEGIWLSPIHPSSSYHKYDVKDYYGIDPKFGTLEDLKELVQLCHSRNVQLILDLVINHTSSQHPWFLKFREAHVTGNTGDPYYNYYSFAADQSANATFCALPGTREYYEGNFSHEMPELDFDNPVVREEMVNVAKFYLELGIDGFRFDAAKYIYFGNEEKNVEFWKWYMEQLRAIKPDLYTVAEVWDGDPITYPYFAALNCFNFSMSQASGQIARAARGGYVSSYTEYVQQYIAEIQSRNPNAMPVTFIANHDMDRTAGFLMTATGAAKVGASLSLLMPGSSFIYYGEEIGMLGSRGGSNTDANRRLAMLWGDGDTVKNPVGANYSAQQANGTVMDQLSDPNSLYNHYKKLIALRKANPEIANGVFTSLSMKEGRIGGFLSQYEGKTVAVIHNTTTDEVTIDLSKYPEIPSTLLAGFAGVGTATLDGTTLTLPGQTSVILR